MNQSKTKKGTTLVSDGVNFFLIPTLVTQRVSLSHVGWQYQPLYMHNKKKFKLFLLSIYWTGYAAFIFSIKSWKVFTPQFLQSKCHKCSEMWSSWSLWIPPRLSLCRRDRQWDCILFVCTWVIGSTKCRE